MFEDNPPRKCEWRIGRHIVAIWKGSASEWYANFEISRLGPLGQSIGPFEVSKNSPQEAVDCVLPLIREIDEIDQRIHPLLEQRQKIVDRLGTLKDER